MAYLRQQMSDSKCEKNCGSMGATNYRLFKDGCCECVGHGCVNYGIDESRCDFEDDSNDQLDYENLSDEELRALEAEYGVLDDTEEGWFFLLLYRYGFRVSEESLLGFTTYANATKPLDYIH